MSPEEEGFVVCQTTTLSFFRCGTAKAQSGPLISFLILPSARLMLRFARCSPEDRMFCLVEEE